MDLVKVCTRCGGKLVKSGDLYVCDYCNASFEEKKTVDVTEELNKLLDKEKQERIAFIRRRLWEAIHEKYIDSDHIVSIAREVRNYLPNDFLACFFEKVNSCNDKQEIANYLNELDCEGNVDDIDVILDFIIKSLEEPYILPINNIIEKTYKNRDLELYNKYITYLEEEAEKLNSLLYELNITRDVFIAYSSKDMKYVNELADVFNENKISYFIAAKNLRHGKNAVQNYDEALKLAIRNCNVVVFVSTENSRKRDCDAISKELPWIKYFDLDKAPVEYRNNYQKLPLKYKKPRVELLIDNYKGTPIEQITKEFFDGNEWCYSVGDVVTRVLKLLTEEVIEEIEVVNTDEEQKKIDIDNELKIISKKIMFKKYQEAEESLIKLCEETEDYRPWLSLVDILIETNVGRADSRYKKYINEALSLCKDESGKDRINKEYSKYLKDTSEKVITRNNVFEEIMNKARPNVNNSFTSRNSINSDTSNQGYQKVTRKKFESMNSKSNNVILEKENDYYKVTTCDGESNDVYIPEIYCQCDVKVIGTKAFRVKKIDSLYIPTSITKFEIDAFLNGNTLIERYIDNIYYNGTIEDWCNIKFDSERSNPLNYANHFFVLDSNNDYKEVIDLVIPNNVTNINDNQFYGCDKIKSVKMSLSVKRIGNNAFGKCSNLIKLTIPFVGENVDESGKTHFGYIFGASSYDKNIEVVPSSLKEVSIIGGNKIDKNAFYKCISLTKIEVPSTITSIGNSAFNGCTNLTNIVIPAGIKRIESSAFTGCIRLVSIDIPEGVLSIGEYAFSDCTSLTDIVIPTTVAFIGSSAFINCARIKSVRIPESLVTIEYSTFANCISLTKVLMPYGVKEIKGSAFLNCSHLVDLMIPNSVIKIGNLAFKDCKALMNITIPETVTSMGKDVFVGCSNLIIKCNCKKPFFGNIKGFEKGWNAKRPIKWL